MVNRVAFKECLKTIYERFDVAPLSNNSPTDSAETGLICFSIGGQFLDPTVVDRRNGQYSPQLQYSV
jgi:hypothetical protein